MLRAAAFALLALAAATWPPPSPRPPAAADERLWLLPNTGAYTLRFDLSDDRKRIFLVLPHDTKPSPKGGRLRSAATFESYDLSEPSIPILLFRLDLGEVGGRVQVRYDRAFVDTNIGSASETLVYAISDIARPTLRGRIPGAPFWIAPDGLTIVVRKNNCVGGFVCMLALDVSDPAKPKEVDLDSVLPPEMRKPAVEIAPDPFKRDVWDRLGDLALSYSGKRYRLWRVNEATKPELIREVGDTGELTPERGRLGPDAAFAVVSRREGIEIVSLKERAFSAEGLRETYRFVLDTVGYKIERALAAKTPWSIEMMQRARAYLENAGVRVLAKHYGPIEGLPENERAQIATAYAMWLDAAGEAVLAASYSNAPQIAMRAVEQSRTWDAKVDFSKRALLAAQGERGRTGKWPASVPNLEALRVDALPRLGADAGVCDYVKTFDAAGRLSEVTAALEGSDVANDKGETRVETFIPHNSDRPWLQTPPDGPEVNFFEPDRLDFTEVFAVPYGRATYILYLNGGKAAALSLANVGMLCTFGSKP